jgi:hypothetical protein
MLTSYKLYSFPIFMFDSTLVGAAKLSKYKSYMRLPM